jgi:hypothetical protein
MCCRNGKWREEWKGMREKREKSLKTKDESFVAREKRERER